MKGMEHAAGGGQSPKPAEVAPVPAPQKEPELSPSMWKYGVEAGAHQEPETLRETRVKLEKAVPALGELARDRLAKENGVLGERTSMREAEGKYLSAYKDFHAKNNALMRLGKKALGTKSSAELEALKQAYNGSRDVYGNALSGSARKRLEAKQSERSAKLREKFDKLPIGEVPMGPNKQPITFEEYEKIATDRVESRYNRLVRFNEVIRPSAEKMLETRVDALDAKGQGVFQQGMAFFGKKNKEFEKWAGGPIRARLYRAAAMAGIGVAVAAGATVMAGAFGTGTILALGSYGAYRFAKSVGFGTLGMFTGKAGAKIGEAKGLKDQKGAREGLKTEGRTGGKLSLDDYDSYDKARINMLWNASDAAVERKKGVGTVIGAMVGGVGGAALANLEVVEALAADGAHIVERGASEIGHAFISPADAHAAHGAMDAHTPGVKVPEVTPQSSAIHIPDADKLKVTISEAHGGPHTADQMWSHFQDNLKAAGYVKDGPGVPPTINHILSLKPHELSNEYSFHGEATDTSMADSGVMHAGDAHIAGDTLAINENGDVTFTPKGAETVRLMTTDAGQVKDVGDFYGAMRPDPLQHHAVHLKHEPNTTPIDHSTDHNADKYNGTRASYGSEQIRPRASAPEPAYAPVSTLPVSPEPQARTLESFPSTKAISDIDLGEGDVEDAGIKTLNAADSIRVLNEGADVRPELGK